MKNKNPHEESSCPVEQDVLEETTEEILEARGNETGRVVPPRRAVNPRRSIPR